MLSYTGWHSIFQYSNWMQTQTNVTFLLALKTIHLATFMTDIIWMHFRHVQKSSGWCRIQFSGMPAHNSPLKVMSNDGATLFDSVKYYFETLHLCISHHWHECDSTASVWFCYKYIKVKWRVSKRWIMQTKKTIHINRETHHTER